MGEVEIKKSNSDTSTDSWTFIEDTDSENSAVPIEDEPLDDQEVINLPEDSIELNDILTEQNRKNDGFLTIDEYLQERLIEHDYENDDRVIEIKARNKGKKEARKCKAENFGLTIFMLILVVLTGFATICSTLATPYYFEEQLERHQSKSVEPAGRNVAVDQNIPMESPKPPDTSTMRKDTGDAFLKKHNATDDDDFEELVCFGPEPKGKLGDESIEIEDYTFDTFRKYYKNHAHIFKSKWELIRELMYDTNLHALISFIMTNIYLITLIAALYRQQTSGSGQSQTEVPERRLQEGPGHVIEESSEAKFLLRQLPFWGQEFEKFTRKRNKISKLRKNQSQRRNLSKKYKKRILQSLMMLSKASLAQQHMEDEGKSECQRRFDELDLNQRKFQNIKQIQRDRVKLLKQKFRNEVSEIRDTEMEAAARAEKINLTSQKFIMRLKYSRDKYLMELKKMREARQKDLALEDKKDVAVGSYAVAMPTGYSFVEKLRAIQDKIDKDRAKMEPVRLQWKFQ